jgi:hypothetical protein
MANPKNITWYDSTGILTKAAASGGFGSDAARKVLEFDGGAGSGAVGQIDLFTVTGANIVRLVAICTESLATNAGATISVGTAANVDGIIAVTTGVDIDIGEIWFAAAPATVLDTLANAMIEVVVGDGADITADVLVEAITDGTIVFYAFVTPITPGASVVAA